MHSDEIGALCNIHQLRSAPISLRIVIYFTHWHFNLFSNISVKQPVFWWLICFLCWYISLYDNISCCEWQFVWWHQVIVDITITTCQFVWWHQVIVWHNNHHMPVCMLTSSYSRHTITTYQFVCWHQVIVDITITTCQCVCWHQVIVRHNNHHMPVCMLTSSYSAT